MKNIIVLLIAMFMTANVFAQYVTVTAPDGTVEIYKGDLQTTSEVSAFYALYDGINQCRLYIKLADGILSQGLNELQTSVDVLPGGDIVFPSISLPPSTANKHSLIMQCLGPVQDGKRQVTFSTESVEFEISPNFTTNLDLGMYLTRLTVKTVINSSYVTPGETYQLETVAKKVVNVTLDAGETAFTMAYDVGDQPKIMSDQQSGEKLGSIANKPSFGNVYTENLNLDVNDGRLNIGAAFMVGQVIMSSPGLLVNDMPDRSDSMMYNFSVRGLDAGNYNVVLTVAGTEVAYGIDVTIGNGSAISATTGRVDSHTVNALGENMDLNINFTAMYDDIDAGVLTNPEVRLFLVQGGGL